jgi:hypothetical protein
MKYVLMFVEAERFAADLAAMDDAERERVYARVGRWFADNTDKVTHHVHLMPSESPTTMRLEGGEPVVTDEPFVEGKEGRERAPVTPTIRRWSGQEAR